MNASLATPKTIEIRDALPPLRHRIRRHFFVLIALYAALGVTMIFAVLLASGITPQLIHVNYDSIAAVREMQDAWDALETPATHPEKTRIAWISQFEKALAFEARNITEPDEGPAAQEVQTLWAKYRAGTAKLDLTTYAQMNGYFAELIRANEQGMFQLADRATRLGQRVFGGSILFFVVTLVLAIFLADGLASRLARPLKQIAEWLREEPGIQAKIKLPPPDTLELRILTTELARLWTRLSQFQAMNVERLAIEREQLETILTSVEDAILVLDHMDLILQISEGMQKVLKLEPSSLLGQPWRDLSTQCPNYIKLRERLQSELGTDNAIELEIDGASRLYAARSREIITPTGTRVGRVYLLHDITEQRHRERLRNEFISVLSHELKTPLQSLGTAAELLATRMERLDPDTRMLVETINEDVSRIRAVANDFIQVSVVDLHALRLKLARIPLTQLLPEWIKPFRVLARDKQVTLDFVKEGSETIWARADAVKLPWAISNLLANAIRVSPPATTVTLHLGDRNGCIEIEVRDEGPGIPEAVQSRMFEPYFQAPAAEAGIATGFLGLGLTIAKEVVEAHEGRLEYFARRPHGSIFRIYLPYETLG